MISTLHRQGGIQRQLYQALVERILSGRIPGGAQLPASRQWAADLGVSRNSISAVYDHCAVRVFWLRGRGVVAMCVKIYTLVLCPDGFHCSPRPPACNPFRGGSGAEIGCCTGFKSPFTPGLPDLEAFPIKVWNRLLHQQESRIRLRGYDEPAGYRPLRTALQHYLRESRGVRCHEDQILITAGHSKGWH